jgi:hypothetical protein
MPDYVKSLILGADVGKNHEKKALTVQNYLNPRRLPSTFVKVNNDGNPFKGLPQTLEFSCSLL